MVGIRTRFILTLLLFLLPVSVPPLLAQQQSDAYSAEVFADINSIRRERGLPDLLPEAAAVSAARKHAEELAFRMTLSHRGLNGMRVNERYRMEGGTAVLSGENLGAGDSIESIVRAWMDSPTHKENILNPQWYRAGVGSYTLSGGRLILVAVFSSSRWEGTLISNTGKNLNISGNIILPAGVPPNAVSISIGDNFYAPVNEENGSPGLRKLSFVVPQNEKWKSEKMLSFFVNFTENGKQTVTDLVLFGKPPSQ